MSPIEAAIYSYLQFLVMSNRGAPAGSAFLKSIGFLDSCFQYMYTAAAVFSTGRWLGVCFVEKATSPRSRLYTCLTDHVRVMERAVAQWTMLDQTRRARFSDGARIKELTLERVDTFRCLKQWPLNAKAGKYLKEE